MIYPVALFALTLLVFGRICGHEFVNFDDPKFISANAALLTPTAQTLAEQWRRPVAHLYMPVTMTVWWVIAQLAGVRDAGGAAGLNPWVFHGASLAAHLINVLLVWMVLGRMIGNARAAAIGAAIFALHPLQVETVAWASEMKDLLAGMFSLAALVALMEAADRKRRWWIAVATICYAAALLSKPSPVTLPLVAAALLWGMGKPVRVWAAVLGIGLVLAVPVIVVARQAQAAIEVAPPPLVQRPLVAADALAFYAGKLVLPVGLGVDYGRTPASIAASGAMWWTWIVPAALTVAAIVAARRGKRMLAAGWMVFVAALASNLGLVPFDFQAVSTVADHYAYFALLGVAIAVAWTVATVPRAGAIMVAFAAVLSVLSFVQAGRWQDSPALWRQALAVNPRSSLALGNMGAFLIDQGDARGATPYLEAAAAMDPNDPFVHLSLVRARLALGDTAAAAQSALDLAAAYQRRAEYNPKLTAEVLEKFAAAIAARGDPASAQRLQEHADRIRRPITTN